MNKQERLIRNLGIQKLYLDEKMIIKDKSGSIFLYSLMLGLTVIILALALAPAVSESSLIARNTTYGDTVGLNCSDTTISNYDKATCTVVDINLFYFIATIIFIGGAVVTAKIIFDS